MKPKITRVPAPKTYAEAYDRRAAISDGLSYLKTAAVKLHDAPNTAARVKLAISSAEGAFRNADGWCTRLRTEGKG